MASEVERLSRGNYLLVTTFRRDGTPVPTPVWVGRDGEELIVWTQAKAGKVKRVRNTGTVEVAECDLRGKPRGATVKGHARILDADGSERGRTVLKRKYGVTGRVVIGASVLRRGRTGTVCLAIELSE
ncbi:MAG: PPOX class F420-dependent oxidoreductase [Actinophytocola sp.]|uniref:PPOX class F420-dependent oxidoreductase n=1 Tax=Actinophytocola sp. TaxID=1872138 RepID=UPI0013227991|nr:PPOX class F420-dependent oxidoreductase [Actinophytocola sp.]MPZ81135.1 PPOX class F420-dependent oxidoreductase [Actinophytocola sp.]